MSAIIDFFTANFWATCVVLSALVITITGYLNAWLKPNTIWKQVISWIVSLALTVGTYFLGLITVSSPVWLGLIATGLVVGLSSNGVYDITFIKSFIQNITGMATSIPEQIKNEEAKQ